MAEKQKTVKELANKLKIISGIKGAKPEPIVAEAISILGKHKAVEDLESLAEFNHEQLGEQALMELEKMLPEFIRDKSTRDLKFLGEHASAHTKDLAFLELAKMIPKFVQTKALGDLKFIGMYASEEIALQAVAGLAELKAVTELSYVSMFALSKGAEEQASAELEKINSEKKFKTTIEEIKALVKELD